MPDRVAGRIPVTECLRAGRRRARRLYVLRDAKGLDELLRLARGVPIEECARHDLDRLVPETPHQGVVLEADPLPLLDVTDFLRGERGPGPLLALDEIEDPHNFGAIVRSAAAFDAAGVVFGRRRAAPVSAAALKAAAGAMEYVPLIEAGNLVRALEALKKAGYWVAGLDADGPQTIWQADFAGPTVLVIGSEGHGMRRLVRETCDYVVRIPIGGPITSLNASVSAALALAECARQRAAR